MASKRPTAAHSKAAAPAAPTGKNKNWTSSTDPTSGVTTYFAMAPKTFFLPPDISPAPKVGDKIMFFRNADGSFDTGRCAPNHGDNLICGLVVVPIHSKQAPGSVILSIGRFELSGLGIVGGHADADVNGGDVAPGCQFMPYGTGVKHSVVVPS